MLTEATEGLHDRKPMTMMKTVERSAKMRAVEMKRAAIDQGVASFCNALKFIGDFWKTNHDWMDKISYDDSEILAEAVIATLHGLMSIVKSKNGDGGDGNRRRVFERLRLDSCSGKTCCFVLPIDATSVLAKLKVPARLTQKLDETRESPLTRASERATNPPTKTPPTPVPIAKGSAPPPPPPTPLRKGSAPTPLGKGSAPPPPPPTPLGKGSAPPPPPPTPLGKGSALPPPPPMPLGKGSAPPAPPTTPLGKGLAPPPPPPTPLGKGSAPPPPPPTPLGKGSAPLPPPPMGSNKRALPSRARPKLKRLTHIAALYRSVKECMEGSAPAVRSTGKVPKAQLGGSQQGMADTIAEMKKKSVYHQQIESDVETYQKVIMSLKDGINSFKTADMVELLKFQRFTESCLVKLTDESQVLTRFEGFPTSKLEAIRSASALHSKLNSVHIDLKSLKISPPSDTLLDRIGEYFDKMKREIEAIERRKDEESKLFERNQIKFDFGIVIRIKEAIVDVCSGCMELVLKEGDESKLVEDEVGRRKANERKNELLWRAVQFAFRVYGFAGGFDDRADKLIRALAREIETSFQAKS